MKLSLPLGMIWSLVFPCRTTPPINSSKKVCPPHEKLVLEKSPPILCGRHYVIPFTSLISFYTSWKHLEYSGLRMFTGDTEIWPVVWNGLKVALTEPIIMVILKWYNGSRVRRDKANRFEYVFQKMKPEHKFSSMKPEHKFSSMSVFSFVVESLAVVFFQFPSMFLEIEISLLGPTLAS